MQTLRPSQVPEYLRTSSFYLGLNVADDDEFSIPLNHMKLNTNVDTLVAMTELLNTIRFWGLDIFPHALIDFAALRPYRVIEPILEPYRADLKFITTLCSIASENVDQSVRLEKAMATGNIGAVRYFHKAAHFTTRAIALAAGIGALDCIKYALPDTASGLYGDRFRNDLIECKNRIIFLQRNGYSVRGEDILPDFEYLYTHDCLINSAAMAAADAGHFDCLEYALEKGARLLGRSFKNAHNKSFVQWLDCTNQLKLIVFALSGDRGTDKPKSANWESFRLVAHHEALPSIRLVALAAERGSVACLEHLYQVCVSKTGAGEHRLNWLFYAHSVSGEGSLRPIGITQAAAKAKQWDCLRFLITHDCPMDRHLTSRLVHAGQLELYYLATAHGCVVSVQTACKFARDGNVSLLQHALEHGCERSEEILRAAARHGQQQCLKYAREQGCPWSALVSLDAARDRHLECLQYLQEHGCPSHAHVRSFLRKHDNVG